MTSSTTFLSLKPATAQQSTNQWSGTISSQGNLPLERNSVSQSAGSFSITISDDGSITGKAIIQGTVTYANPPRTTCSPLTFTDTIVVPLGGSVSSVDPNLAHVTVVGVPTWKSKTMSCTYTDGTVTTNTIKIVPGGSIWQTTFMWFNGGTYNDETPLQSYITLLLKPGFTNTLQTSIDPSISGYAKFSITSGGPAPQPNFDFNISTPEKPFIVTPGGSTDIPVSINLAQGTAQQVSLSVSGDNTISNHITTTFSDASDNPTFQSNLNIAVDATTPPGDYKIIVTGNGGGITHQDTIFLQVNQMISGTISSLSGDVEILKQGGSWQPITKDTIISIGDSIKTGPNSLVTITFSEGSELEINQNSAVGIGGGNGGINTPYLDHGLMWFYRTETDCATTKTCMTIETEILKAVEKGTDFLTYYNPSDTSQLILLKEGSLDVTLLSTGQIFHYDAPWEVAFNSTNQFASIPLRQNDWNTVVNYYPSPLDIQPTPEFGSLAIMVAAISIIGAIFISNKFRFNFSK